MAFHREIKAALSQVHASSLQLRLLRELAQAPQTAAELARHLGLHHHVTVNRAFTDIGYKVRQHLSKPPKGLTDGTYQWWAVLAIGKQLRKGYEWTLRPEVWAAMSELGWLAESDFKLPEELVATNAGMEGAVQTITVNRYERDHRLRTACIQNYGARCCVCCIDMGKVYGEHAQGLIHVHHLAPLSEANGPKTVDPVRDMRPLCPNCHAVAHRRNPPFTMNELRSLLHPKK